MKRKTVLLAGALLGGVLSTNAQQTFPYFNDFTLGDDFSVQDLASGSGASYTHDAGNGVFNFTKEDGAGTTGTKNNTAGLQITGQAGQDFVMSSQFTVNDISFGTPLSVNVRIGFGALSGSDSFLGSAAPYYLVTWAAAANPDGSADIGDLVISALGDNTGFSTGAHVNPGVAVPGTTYEMVLSGVYVAGTLNLDLELFDVTGAAPVLLGSRAATDTQPLTGEWFGLRHSTAHPSHALNIDHHDFAVVPEPATAGLVAGLSVLAWLVFVRRRQRS